MNKTAALLAALAAGAASGVVHAQTNVTIYGIVDAALVGESGGSAGHVTKVTSGAASASRIGFRGEESLGNDLSAFFDLETGSKIDTGEVDAAGTIFNRQAVVGLKSKAYGALGLGRQYTPYHTMLAGVVDPFGTGYAGTSKNLFPDGLSRRTGLYAAYGQIDHRNGAGYTVANNTESGTGNTGYNLGIRHTF